MIFDFNYYNPTKIYFGKTALSNLKGELESYGRNVLLLYGKNSIKKIGLYDEVLAILKACDKNVVELAGINSNPRYTQVLEGARLVRENNVDLILAVGGGSVVDCAKAISVSAYAKGNPWHRYWINQESVDNKIVPVGTVLTMTGTASEMNGGSVITNEEEMIKTGRVYPSDVYPKFSILNPEYTYTVPKHQMVSGIFDIFSHLLEQYFSGSDDNTTDYVIEGVLASLINSARVAVQNPTDYEARSNIMWCATLGLNTITGLSKEQDWEVHMIEHQLGAYTDCPHGLGLAVISVPYYKYIYKYGLDKFVRFATKVWKVDAAGKTKEEIALAGIDALAAFIKELGIPSTLRELGATEEMLPLIAKSTVKGGGYKYMEEEDILAVLKECF
ncbi:MAG: iron-containing alcohol dehydrogenase [Lachnospiraceae bacterium]|nr:iron-containing alcohol dehydrogenase [Lachnospiraceae bacterium]